MAGTSTPRSADSPPPELVDLLGALSYASLAGFGRTAAVAELAPNLTAKAVLSRLAVISYRNYEVLAAELADLGVDTEAAATAFIPPIDAFHARTRTTDWLEGLLTSYLGAGLALDFSRELATGAAGPSGERVRSLMQRTVRDRNFSVFAEQTLTAALAADPRASGRLALWSRRLVGEALSQAQRVAADRIELTELVAGGLAEFATMLARLTDRHNERVRALGLA